MTNLPLLRDFTCSEDEKQNHFGLSMVPHIAVVEPFLAHDDGGPLDYEVQCNSKCFTLVTDATNQNLSSAQKELICWHQKLCLNMQDPLS